MGWSLGKARLWTDLGAKSFLVGMAAIKPINAPLKTYERGLGCVGACVCAEWSMTFSQMLQLWLPRFITSGIHYGCD